MARWQKRCCKYKDSASDSGWQPDASGVSEFALLAQLRFLTLLTFDEFCAPLDTVSACLFIIVHLKCVLFRPSL